MKKTLFIFLSLMISINVINNNVNSKDIVIKAEKIKRLFIPDKGFYIDTESGQTLGLENVKISNHIKDNSGIDYSIETVINHNNNLDGSWCIKGTAIGEWMKADIPESQYFQYKGVMNVYRIVVVNGLSISKNLYFANNRVKTMEAEFSNGEKRILECIDDPFDIDKTFKVGEQQFKINIKSKWIKLTIKDIYRGNKYNDTCISTIAFETEKHPDDVKK